MSVPSLVFSNILRYHS